MSVVWLAWILYPDALRHSSSCHRRRVGDNDNTHRIESRIFFFFFFTISSLHRELSPTRTLKWPGRNRVQSTCNTSSVYHVQLVVYHLVERDSSAIKFNRVYITFIF